MKVEFTRKFVKQVESISDSTIKSKVGKIITNTSLECFI